MKINQDNWTYCQFRQGDLRAVINLGADFDSEESEPRTIYIVNVLNEHHRAIREDEFGSLEEAVQHINHTYKNVWPFENQLKTVNVGKEDDGHGGGCSSCQAH
ncbi:MAG: hypothetical protein QE271_10215 [Bacteriovoracaceae bacterium]|nr:hypothetical protein [Bacteriovoracaceae bacterium]